ncbi:MAG: alcohol dehydrogenase catalytic domain-containing protein, partial [Paracoccaceae bacterium]
MARTIIIQSHGGPEVMALVDRPVPAPAAGEVTIAHHAIGLNYIDTYHRSGLYPLPLPTSLGSEAAGVIT